MASSSIERFMSEILQSEPREPRQLTTEQALNTFMQNNMEALVEKAMQAAKQRSIELSEEFGK